MAITWLNKSQLDVSDLHMIHGHLCQDEEANEATFVEAPPNKVWQATLKLEWGVPVVVISKATEKRNWRGNYIWEESRIPLDALANKIDDMSENILNSPNSEYERLLGLDIQGRLKQFKKRETVLLKESWIGRLLNKIRGCFPSARRDPMKSMETNFRRYTARNFHDQFVDNHREFTISDDSYTHVKAEGLFDRTALREPDKSKLLVLVKTAPIYEKAQSSLNMRFLINRTLSHVT